MTSIKTSIKTNEQLPNSYLMASKVVLQHRDFGKPKIPENNGGIARVESSSLEASCKTTHTESRKSLTSFWLPNMQNLLFQLYKTKLFVQIVGI